MKNTLSITQLPDGRFRTEINAYDGITIVEVHRAGLHDSKVLSQMQAKKYYQQFPGIWYIVFPDAHNVIQRPSFDSAVDVAQDYIFNRDNSVDYSGFC